MSCADTCLFDGLPATFASSCSDVERGAATITVGTKEGIFSIKISLKISSPTAFSLRIVSVRRRRLDGFASPSSV